MVTFPEVFLRFMGLIMIGWLFIISGVTIFKISWIQWDKNPEQDFWFHFGNLGFWLVFLGIILIVL